MRGTVTAVLLVAILAPAILFAADEVSLYDNFGKPVAFIAMDDEMTVYLWTGRPVAYLINEDETVHVYGFNGSHLGWFDEGVIFTHSGQVSCAIKSRTASPKFETMKGFKQFEPFKAYRAFAPGKPLFSDAFSPMSCTVHLGAGR